MPQYSMLVRLADGTYQTRTADGESKEDAARTLARGEQAATIEEVRPKAPESPPPSAFACDQPLHPDADPMLQELRALRFQVADLQQLVRPLKSYFRPITLMLLVLFLIVILGPGLVIVVLLGR